MKHRSTLNGSSLRSSCKKRRIACFSMKRPAAISIAALNLLRLAQFRDDKKLDERARKTLDAFAPTLSHFASAMPQMLVALHFSLSKPRQIVIAGKIDNNETKALLAEVHRHFLPRKILILADGGEGQKFFSEKNEAI